jgi:type IV pilus assembly protein PilM
LQIGAALAKLMDKIGEKAPFFSKLKQPAAQNYVGVDIGGQRIKVLQINAHETPFKIEHFGIADLPDGAIVKEEIKNVPAIADTLYSLFKTHDITTKEVAIAIPKSLAVIKTVSIDSRFTESEIESKAWVEANRHFPDLIGNIYLDFAIAGPDIHDPNQSELVLVASRKDHVNPYLEIIDQAGLKIQTIDINCYVYERVLRRINQYEMSLHTIGMLNLNSNLSSFVVLNDNRLIHAHDHAFDVTKLLPQVKSYFTEKYHDQVDEMHLATDENYFSILRANLLSHLRHTIHFFYSSRPNISIQRLMLSGELTTIPHLAAFVQKEIGLETEMTNPVRDMTMNNNVNGEQLNRYAPELTLCCGLAIYSATGKT